MSSRSDWDDRNTCMRCWARYPREVKVCPECGVPKDYLKEEPITPNDHRKLRQMAPAYLKRYRVSSYINEGVHWLVRGIAPVVGILSFDWSLLETLIFMLATIWINQLLCVLPKFLFCPDVFDKGEEMLLDTHFVDSMLTSLRGGKDTRTAFATPDGKSPMSGGKHRAGWLKFDIGSLALVTLVFAGVLQAYMETHSMSLRELLSVSLLNGLGAYVFFELISEAHFYITYFHEPQGDHAIVPYTGSVVGCASHFFLWPIFLPIIMLSDTRFMGPDRAIAIVAVTVFLLFMILAAFKFWDAFTVNQGNKWLRAYLAESHASGL